MPAKKSAAKKQKSAAQKKREANEKAFREGAYKDNTTVSATSLEGGKRLRYAEIQGAMNESRRRGEEPMSSSKPGFGIVKTKVIDKKTGKTVYPRKK